VTTIYGIRNCDTMKKAIAWLASHGVDHRFHDYRKDGVPIEALKRWVGILGWEQLLNTRGTTFRKLPASQQQPLDATRALALMEEHPACIRRPVLELGDVVVAGFVESRYRELLGEP
jgi:arsenate reductase (glutaredoxin)